MRPWIGRRASRPRRTPASVACTRARRAASICWRPAAQHRLAGRALAEHLRSPSACGPARERRPRRTAAPRGPDVAGAGEGRRRRPGEPRARRRRVLVVGDPEGLVLGHLVGRRSAPRTCPAGARSTASRSSRPSGMRPLHQASPLRGADHHLVAGPAQPVSRKARRPAARPRSVPARCRGRRQDGEGAAARRARAGSFVATRAGAPRLVLVGLGAQVLGEGLEAHDLHGPSVLGHDEVVLREAGDGPALLVEDDRVHGDELDLGGEDGDLAAGAWGTGGAGQPARRQRSRMASRRSGLTHSGVHDFRLARAAAGHQSRASKSTSPPKKKRPGPEGPGRQEERSA